VEDAPREPTNHANQVITEIVKDECSRTVEKLGEDATPRTPLHDEAQIRIDEWDVLTERLVKRMQPAKTHREMLGALVAVGRERAEELRAALAASTTEEREK